jgi:hypothetical protein
MPPPCPLDSDGGAMRGEAGADDALLKLHRTHAAENRGN